MTINELNIASENIQLRATDTDRFYDATIPFFFSSSQEVAGEHATKIGVGIEEMSNKNKRTWVIVRNKMCFYKIPKWMDKIVFETFPQKGYKLFCPRVVRAKDENGEVIMNSMTHWVVMDLERMRPLPPKVIEGQMKLADDSFAENPDIGKILKYDEQEHIEEYEKRSFKPSYFDIDYNRHVNNVVYTNWICESLKDEVMLNYRIKEIDAQWESQTYEDDEVVVETALTSKNENTITLAHRILKKSDGKTAFEANSVWVKKEN